jgi:hypothetical protein
MKPKPQEKNKKSAEHLTQRHWHEMNRKQRRETMRKMESQELLVDRMWDTALCLFTLMEYPFAVRVRFLHWVPRVCGPLGLSGYRKRAILLVSMSIER